MPATGMLRRWWDRVTLPTYRNEERERFRLSCESWHGPSRGAVLQVIGKTLLPIVQSNVIVHAPRAAASVGLWGAQKTHERRLVGAPMAPSEDPGFHVYLWSAPRDLGRRVVPVSAFGQIVGTKQFGFLSPRLGEEIVTPEGRCIAELIDQRHLYLLWELPSEHGQSLARELQVLEAIFAKLPPLLALSSEEAQARLRRRESETKEAVRAQFVDVAYAQARERYALDEVYAREQDAAILRQENELRLARTRQIELQQAFGELQGLHQQVVRRAEEQFEAMASIEGVRSIQVLDRLIQIETAPIYCLNSKTNQLHELGEFRIEIWTDGSNNGVRWFNETRRVDGVAKAMHAPLVRADGNAVYPHLVEVFTDLIAEEEYAAVASLAIQFLQSPDPEITGSQFVDRWPIAPQESGRCR